MKSHPTSEGACYYSLQHQSGSKHRVAAAGVPESRSTQGLLAPTIFHSLKVHTTQVNTTEVSKSRPHTAAPFSSSRRQTQPHSCATAPALFSPRFDNKPSYRSLYSSSSWPLPYPYIKHRQQLLEVLQSDYHQDKQLQSCRSSPSTELAAAAVPLPC
jgi:hypothetical protein